MYSRVTVRLYWQGASLNWRHILWDNYGGARKPSEKYKS